MQDVSTTAVGWARDERLGFLEEGLRQRTRQWIQAMVQEELDDALGLARYERGAGRRGYRKGLRRRSFTTCNGRHELRLPRGAFFERGPDGTKEWHSRLVPRYARRSDAVEEALIRCYLGGTNTRRLEQALRPLLKGAALSRSTVSRLLARLSEAFEAWRGRDLSGEDIGIVFLDGFGLRIRWGGRVESVPVLAALGVATDGRRMLLGLQVRTSESAAAWRAMTEDLARRGVTAPVLAVIDGNAGLREAVKTTWPWIEVQRCTKHKLENLATHAPKRQYEAVKADYHAIVYAESEAEARAAWGRFERRWEKTCPDLVRSLREGGEELLTFLRWPKAMWKRLRTTNAIERLNEEFRRRVKTQGSFPNAEGGLKVLYGLLACGVITLRRFDAWPLLAAAVETRRVAWGLKKPLAEAG